MKAISENTAIDSIATVTSTMRAQRVLTTPCMRCSDDTCCAACECAGSSSGISFSVRHSNTPAVNCNNESNTNAQRHPTISVSRPPSSWPAIRPRICPRMKRDNMSRRST